MKSICEKCGAILKTKKKIYQINKEKLDMLDIIDCINFLLKNSPKKKYTDKK